MEIADKLQLSVRTIEGYRLKILEKWDANNILKVTMDAIMIGYIRTDEEE